MESWFQSLVLKHAAAGPSLGTTGRREVAKLCEVIKQHLQQKARDLVDSARDLPILQLYSSDGTPLQTRERLAINVPGHKKFIRQAGSSKEYRCQQS